MRYSPLPCSTLQKSQLSGQGEGDEEIAARHQGLRLPFNPTLALKVLAMGAVAVTAGMRHQALLRAARALSQHARCQAGAAQLHPALNLSDGNSPGRHFQLPSLK